MLCFKAQFISPSKILLPCPPLDCIPLFCRICFTSNASSLFFYLSLAQKNICFFPPPLIFFLYFPKKWGSGEMARKRNSAPFFLYGTHEILVSKIWLGPQTPVGRVQQTAFFPASRLIGSRRLDPGPWYFHLEIIFNTWFLFTLSYLVPPLSVLISGLFTRYFFKRQFNDD